MERRLDLAARERLLAALARLAPGLSRIERDLDALEAARLALLVHDLRRKGTEDPQPPAACAAPSGVPDELFEESLLSDLSERTEDFIATCRDAISAERRGDGGEA